MAHIAYNIESSAQFIESRPRTPTYCAEAMYTCQGSCTARYGGWEVATSQYEVGNTYVGFDFLDSHVVRQVSLAQHHGAAHTYCKSTWQATCSTYHSMLRLLTWLHCAAELELQHSDTAGNTGPWSTAHTFSYSNDAWWVNVGQPSANSELCPQQAFGSTVWQKNVLTVPDAARSAHRAWRINCVDTDDISQFQFFDLMFYE